MKPSLILTFLLVHISLFSQDTFKANTERIHNRIEEIAQFGALPSGGVNRVAYSDADIKARLYVVAMMKNAGLEVIIDQAGNIIGRKKGSNPNRPFISVGSHIDSVPEGGNYDGVAGVIAALECIELMNENNILTKHPIEVILFANEEGGLVGSMAMNGTLTAKDLDRISNSGKTIRQGIIDIGGNPMEIEGARRNAGEIKAFLELHVEQGATLFNEGIEIGIVEGIVGIETWEVTIEGNANHAGTTPMKIRHDALLAASMVVIAVNESVNSLVGNQVGTVGKINAEPGASNVVPGKVTLTIEIRDISTDKIMMIFGRIAEKMKAIAEDTGTRITWKPDHSNIPAIMDKTIRELLTKSARENGLSYKSMPSGAGHDAQDMAKIAPTGMIFVPSREGISHSPIEFTKAEEVANGAIVMFNTILKIDLEKNW